MASDPTDGYKIASIRAVQTFLKECPASSNPLDALDRIQWTPSIESGGRFRSNRALKRHLRTRYDMTPEEYRRRWGLPDDYPMVAPSYAARRSALAKKNGLGRPKTSAKSVRTPKPRKKATKKS